MNPLILNTHVVRDDLAHRRSEFARAQKPRGRRSTIRRGAAVLGVFIGFAAAEEARSAQTTLVNEVQGVYADDASQEPSASANGRFVAFSSYATNLSQDDGDGALDVFVRDMREPTTILASRANGDDGAGGQADSYDPSISANGRYVAFTSLYNDFTDEDEQFADVFVRDFKTGTTTLVSRYSGPSGDGGNGASAHPSISASGRYVAFESVATNLHEDAKPGFASVYVRDLKTYETILVSRRSANQGKGANGASNNPSISANGMRVAFSSNADNLSPADKDGFSNVFVRDLGEATTDLVSRGSGNGRGGDNYSFSPEISADGQVVAFASYANNLHPQADNTNIDVFARELGSGRTILVSRRSGAKGAAAEDSSTSPSISGDGRFVAFETGSTNLSKADDAAYLNDVFVRDLERDQTTLASRAGADGPAGDGNSGAASFAADGRSLVFESEASNFSQADPDLIPDVFQRVLGGTTG